MDQPTTSTTIEGGQQLEPENLGSLTTKTIKRMIWKLKLDQNSNQKSISLGEPVGRTTRYTGMNRVNVEKLLAFGDTMMFEHVQVNRRIIHGELINTYVDKGHIPTISELFNNLGDKLPICVDVEYFTKILIKMGYVFYKFPKQNALRVMEKKSVSFERYRYLKSIQQYRKDKVPIVYVGLTSLTERMDLLNLEKTLQTDVNNIFAHVFFTATEEAIENIKVIPATTYEVLKDTVKDWLLEIFALETASPQGCMCVLEDSKIFRDASTNVPTWKSVKKVMVDWLEENNIPCHIDMPKANLLQLIETYTDTTKNTFVIDNFAKQHNYSVLRIPQCINGLSISAILICFYHDKEYFKGFHTGVNINEVLLSNISADDLKEFSSSIQAEENNQLDEDIKVDNILDELVEKMKFNDSCFENHEDDTVLPTYSDSE